MQDLNTGDMLPYEEAMRDLPKKQQGVILFEGQMIDIKSQNYRVVGLRRKAVVIQAWETAKPELSKGEIVFVGESKFVVDSVGSEFATLRGLPGTRFKEGEPY
jgi:hypothetical protein